MRAARVLGRHVVDRSQGVFLRVHLVVRDLLEGLTYNDSTKNLQSRLESFPADLEDFFQHMIDAIPKVYLPRASRMFRIATSADRPIYLIFYSLLEDIEDDEKMTIDEPICGMPATEMEREDAGCAVVWMADPAGFWKPSKTRAAPAPLSASRSISCTELSGTSSKNHTAHSSAGKTPTATLTLTSWRARRFWP